MIFRKDLKERSKKIAFNNKWNFWKIIFVLFLLSFFIGFITELSDNIVFIYISSVIVSLVGSFIAIGYLSYIMNLTEGKKVYVEDIFFYYRYMGSILIKNILLGLFYGTFGFITLFILVPILSYLYLPISILIFAFYILLFSYIMTRLIMVNYVMADEPGISGFDAILKSWKMMKGRYIEYLVLQISFFWWNLLVSVTYGIAIIWVLPYISCTNAMYFLELKKNYEGN